MVASPLPPQNCKFCSWNGCSSSNSSTGVMFANLTASFLNYQKFTWVRQQQQQQQQCRKKKGNLTEQFVCYTKPQTHTHTPSHSLSLSLVEPTLAPYINRYAQIGSWLPDNNNNNNNNNRKVKVITFLTAHPAYLSVCPRTSLTYWIGTVSVLIFSPNTFLTILNFFQITKVQKLKFCLAIFNFRLSELEFWAAAAAIVFLLCHFRHNFWCCCYCIALGKKTVKMWAI